MLHYKCDRCEFDCYVDYLPRAYRLDADRFVEMSQRHFWCGACNRFSVCESLSADSVRTEFQDEELARLREILAHPPGEYGPPRRRELIEFAAAPREISDLEQVQRDWADWRSRRTAPIKCLRCEAVVNAPPEHAHQSIGHGHCGGVLRLSMRLESSSGYATYSHVYDIDGRLIEQGSKVINVNRDFGLAPTPTYGPLELFFEPLDHDPYEALEKSLRETP